MKVESRRIVPGAMIAIGMTEDDAASVLEPYK